MPADKRTQYPVCIGGRRQCPPEDCGGIPGFVEFMAVMQNPRHPDHMDMLVWHGEHFDPAEFSPQQVIFDDPDQRWEYCFGEGQDDVKLEDLVLPTRMRRMLARAGTQ